MKRFFFILLLIACYQLTAQTRFYLSLGTNSTTDFNTKASLHLGLTNNSIVTSGGFYNGKMGVYNRVEFNLEKRMFGSLYLVSGLGWFNTGYVYSGDSFYSRLNNSYLNVPVILRFNWFNYNYIYIDGGLMGNYLTSSHLKERWYTDADEGNITKHMSRFSANFIFQLSFVVNRFTISAYKHTTANGSAEDFSTSWGVPRNGSAFLLYVTNYSFKSGGVKISYRIK